MRNEIYQVYNKHTRQYVKMRDGKILDNSYLPYDDIPLFGPGPETDQDQDNKKKPGSESESEQLDTSLKPEQNEPTESAESIPGNDPKEDNSGDDYSGVGMF